MLVPILNPARRTSGRHLECPWVQGPRRQCPAGAQCFLRYCPSICGSQKAGKIRAHCNHSTQTFFSHRFLPFCWTSKFGILSRSAWAGVSLKKCAWRKAAVTTDLSFWERSGLEKQEFFWCTQNLADTANCRVFFVFLCVSVGFPPHNLRKSSRWPMLIVFLWELSGCIAV